MLPLRQTDIALRIQNAEDDSARPHDSHLANDTKSAGLDSSRTTPSVSQNKPNETRLSSGAKILFLDGLRGTAVIFVVITHTGYLYELFVGAVGVDAFFVLSSYLLTMIFMKKSITMIAENASYRKWGYAMADYFSRRFFRVYPLFALVSITVWLMPLEYKKFYYKVRKPEEFSLFLMLTFHPEHRHYLLWTLPLEISYYFILPMFVLAVLKLGRFWWMSFIPLYVWVIHEGLYTIRTNFYRQPLSAHLPTFVAGSMSAVIFVKLDLWIKASGFKFRKLHIVALRIVEAVLIAAYLSVIFDGLFINWLGFGPLPPVVGYKMPFTSVKLSLLIVIEMIRPSAVSEIFEWVVLRYMGKISFSVYLLHVFVIFTPRVRYEAKYYDKYFMVFGLVTLLASISYHLVEVPSQLLAQRLSRKFARLASYEHEKVVDQSDTEDSGEHDTDEASIRLLALCRK